SRSSRRERSDPLMDRTPQRRERLARTLKGEQADALLVASTTNVRYLTGFTGEDAILLLTPDRALIVSDGRFTTQLQTECPRVEADIRPVGEDLIAAVATAAGKLGVRRLAYESKAISVADFEELRARLPTVELVGISDRVESLRAIKDKDEIAAIREAVG